MPTTSKYAGSATMTQAAPTSVLNIVSGKPVAAGEVASSAHTTSSVGPARGYAKAAGAVMPTSATGADGKAIDVPKIGPPAVAVGRAMAEGRPAVSMAGGKLVTTISKKFQIVFVTSEVAPFSKTGGLGEAMDGLPIALAALGHRCMVISPRYDQYKEAWDTGYWGSVPMGGKNESVHFFHTYKQKVDYVFVDHPTFLERVNGLTGAKLYGPEWGQDFADNQARFAYFCKAALKAIQELPLGGAVYGGDCMVVCNDWHSALVPMLIHAEKPTGKWTNTKSAFLCHNAVFQGRFVREEGLASVFGVPERYIDSITFKMPLRIGKYNEKMTCINTMAAGLRYADRALTVSPSYAVECCTDPEKGVELEDLFSLGKCTGILNGVKEGVTPSDKNFVTKTMMSCGIFTAATAPEAKAELKATYRAQNNLPASTGPLMCFIGRLDAQKGYDLLLEALVEILEDTELQVVIVGSGRADLVAQTKAVEKKFPSKFFYAGWMGPERYALLAGCDYTLLPSRWEPCGLVQMEAMRMGTLPIVAPTGGLKDTVEDGLNGLWTDKEMSVEAVIDEESVQSIAKALKRASKLFIEEPEKVKAMTRAAMAASAEFTWSNAALQYEAVFEELGVKDMLKGRTATVTLETDKQEKVKAAGAAPTAATAASAPPQVPKSKAAALVTGASAPKASGSGPTTTSPASAGVSAAAPKSKAVSPISAAAVMEEGKKPATAAERFAATGSVLARGMGAKAEAPKAKAKPAAAMPTTSKYAGSATMTQAAPTSVLNIVSGKPVAAGEVASSAHTTSSVGPARGYAKAAGAVLPSSAPKIGPPAVAVGRAMAEGRPAVSMAGGKLVTTISKKFQIVFVTSEVAPFSKTGGLGEAMDGLPIALAALGHRCMVISPRYDQYKEAWDTGYWGSVPMGGKNESVHFFHTYKQKVDYVFVDHPTFLERVNGLTGAKLYGPEWGQDFADNQARFAYFCKAALKAIQELPLGGAVYGGDCMVVCNDWHSALVPMLIHAEKPTGKWTNTKSAFLCHNAVFQGRFVREEGLASVFGVPERYIDSITFKMPLRIGKYNEKMSCINTMAAGLRYADRALTVSPSYAVECCTDPEKGVELEDLFSLGKCTGILNGVKEGVTPSDKNFVTKTMMSCGVFTAATAPEAKAELKASYRAQNNLPASTGPLMCFIGRLDAQKGYDLLLEALVEILEDTELQVVIVGSGRADLVAQTKAVEKKYPTKFFYGGWMGPERYALLAGCDYTLLPSRWEPCGLVQMEAMRMGTLPIVAPTGGLKDTVEDGLNGLWTDKEMSVEAVIDEESVQSIAKALKRASKLFIEEPEKVKAMTRAAMAASAEFTWSNAALQYEAVFEELGVKDTLKGGTAVVTLETDKQVC
ncbi:unnamed protein product [Symbiodinium sp. CCMP2592]|nr:unnamed protein product [Symbiodinium sp. CCMP2592]